MAGSRRLWTRANALTLLRLAMLPVLAWAAAEERTAVALLAFAVAVASDFADGPVARRYGEATPLGGLLDHTTDALFVSGGLAAYAARGEVFWLLPVLVLAAFLQYALDSRAGGEMRLRASRLGRWNGIAYFVLLGVPVVRDGLGLGVAGPAVVHALSLVLVATTILSMGDRAWAFLTRTRTRERR